MAAKKGIRAYRTNHCVNCKRPFRDPSVPSSHHDEAVARHSAQICTRCYSQGVRASHFNADGSRKAVEPASTAERKAISQEQLRAHLLALSPADKSVVAQVARYVPRSEMLPTLRMLGLAPD